ncbi:MAG TPA: hypothetical protein VL463_02610 [Kofleriaceae bacterium]|jgi:hypothetical protein|nr:hypothetical protein [Kofleriaceae bacterium]
MTRALLLIAIAACSDRSADPAPAPASPPGPASKPDRVAGPITVRDPNGAIVLELVTAAGKCTAKPAPDPKLTIDRASNGDQILRDGKNVVRVWRDATRPGHVDLVDPDGMAVARIDSTAAAATLTDAAGRPTSTVVFEGGRFVAKDPNEAVLAYVQGGDAEIAALVVAPLPPDVRALAACDRLTAPVSL